MYKLNTNDKCNLSFPQRQSCHLRLHLHQDHLLLNPALREGHRLLNLRNRQCRVQSLGTRPRAVQNGMTPVQTHTIVESILPLFGLLISRIRNPSVRLHEYSRTKILFRIPPVRRARSRTAGAKDAFVETIEFSSFGFGLQVFFALGKS